ASARMPTIWFGSLPVHSAGSAMMLTRSLRQRRSRAASSAGASTGDSTSDRHMTRTLSSTRSKLRQKLFGGHEEGVPLNDAADDDHRMRPHDVDHGVAAELPGAVRADHRIGVTAPDVVDAGFELDHVVDGCPAFGKPIHLADNTAERKWMCRVTAGELLEYRQHSILIEVPVANVGLRAAAQFELAALRGGRSVDACGGQATQMIGTLVRVDDVNRFVPTVEPVFHEWQEHPIFLIVAPEERADMTGVAERRASQGNRCRIGF